MPRVLAIDYGLKRTGLAVTDELQIIASGLTSIPSGDVIAFLKKYFAAENVGRVLIGKPVQMNNQPSESAPLIEKFVAEFSAEFPEMPITRVDERFTSKLASRAISQSGLGKKKRQDKGLIDEVAAAIMLQDYLMRKMI